MKTFITDNDLNNLQSIEQSEPETVDTKPLTGETKSAYPVPEVPQGTGITQAYGAVETTAEIERSKSPYTLTRAQKKAMRVEILHLDSGATVPYSFDHAERLLRQERAYIDGEGRIVRGIPPIDPERVYLRHGPKLNQPVLRRSLPWQECWRTTKAGVWPWHRPMGTPGAGEAVEATVGAQKPRLDQIDGDPQE